MTGKLRLCTELKHWVWMWLERCLLAFELMNFTDVTDAGDSSLEDWMQAVCLFVLDRRSRLCSSTSDVHMNAVVWLQCTNKNNHPLSILICNTSMSRISFSRWSHSHKCSVYVWLSWLWSLEQGDIQASVLFQNILFNILLLTDNIILEYTSPHHDVSWIVSPQVEEWLCFSVECWRQYVFQVCDNGRVFAINNCWPFSYWHNFRSRKTSPQSFCAVLLIRRLYLLLASSAICKSTIKW